MTHQINYFKVLKEGWKKILIMAISISLLSTLFSFVRPLEYSSTIRMLVIQRSTLGLDPYTALRSVEQISENLVNIIYTTSFFDKVMASDFNIDKSVFNQNEEKKRKQWEKMIDASVSRGTGLLSISVFHKDRAQAEQIAYAIGSVLQEEGWTYVGGGDLQMRIVDSPLTSRWPARPNIPVNAFGGLVLGIVAGVIYVVFVAFREKSSENKNFLHEIK